jgi:hypothetical protein
MMFLSIDGRLTVPLVYISDCGIGGVLVVAPGTSRVIDCSRVFFLQQFGKEVLVRIPRRKRRLEPSFRIAAVRVVLQFVPLEDLVVFIIPSPHHQRRMRPQPPHILPSFELHALQKSRIGRIIATSEREVLPHQDPKLVAGVEESIVFVDSSAPYADHDLVAGG